MITERLLFLNFQADGKPAAGEATGTKNEEGKRLSTDLDEQKSRFQSHPKPPKAEKREKPRPGYMAHPYDV